MILDSINQEFLALKGKKNYRSLPRLIHDGRDMAVDGRQMLSLSPNDYPGLAGEVSLRGALLKTITPETFLPTSSSSRLLTNSFTAYQELEQQLTTIFGAESALLFNSGYYANTGTPPAISDTRTLVLTDRLVHTSLIDGIRLSPVKCTRYRRNDLTQLRHLLEENHGMYEKMIIVTESIFSMDRDGADLQVLVRLRHDYSNLLLYVNEAHAFGARGEESLECTEKQNCINDIDFLVGTFGKAAASVGTYVVCRQTTREYLINKMRTFIFTAAPPPVSIQWTTWVLKRFVDFRGKREHLLQVSRKLKEALTEEGYNYPSVSHIVPMVVGTSEDTIRKAEELQHKGFYILPVRPPAVPEETSRTYSSLTADITEKEIDTLIETING